MRSFIILLSFAILTVLTLSIFIIALGDYPLTLEAVLNDPLALNVFLQLRLSPVLTAIFVGISLSLSGLMMQTYFLNPLADPFILGVSSASGLVLAFFILFMPPLVLLNIGHGLLGVLGAFLFLLLLLFVIKKANSQVSVLIMGLLFSYLANSVISILLSLSDPFLVKDYLLWSLGSFESLRFSTSLILVCMSLFSSFLCFLLSKYFNLLLLGKNVFLSFGLNFKQFTFLVLSVVSLLTGLVVSHCGPIAFLGLACPYLAKILLKSSDHKKLIPLTILSGMSFALLAEFLIKVLPISIPLNALLGFLSAPLIILLLWKTTREL